MSRMKHFWRTFACAVGLLALGLAGTADAQVTTSWAGGSSANWSDPSNWDNGLPASELDVTIDAGGFSTLYDPVLDADGAAKSLTIGYGELLHDNLLTIGAPYALTVTGNTYVGQTSGTTSTISQSDGTLTTAELWLGSTDAAMNGAGTYLLSGGTLNITGRQIVVGEQGVGTFTQTGGVVNNPTAFYVGDNWVGHSQSIYPGAGGTLTVSGGVFNGGAAVGIIGTWGGNGTLNVNGTGVLNQNSLEMGLSSAYGNTAGSNSAINLSGNGQINLTGYMTLAANEATTGAITQSGGILTVGTIQKGPGTGTYDLTGGTLNVSAVRDMGLTNDGATLNVGGPGAIATLVFGDPGGEPINLALGKSATQAVDPNWGYPASNGVDGNYNNFTHCTQGDANNYWEVDLTGDTSNVIVNRITVYPRNDYAWCPAFLSNFYIRFTDKDGVVTSLGPFVTETPLGLGEAFEIPLDGASYDTRYIKVQLDGFALDGNGYLCLAELEAFDTNNVTPSAYTDYAQNAASTLGIELDPDNLLCDKLVAGALTLAGTLDVTALSTGFANGQVFDILDWETLIGTFDTVNLPTLSGSLAWDTSNLYVTGELAINGPTIPGDANGNGYVDAADAQILAQNWGASGEGIGWDQGDFNGDKAVNAADASILAANWTGSGESAGVPEPGTVTLLVMGAAGLLAFARRRARQS